MQIHIHNSVIIPYQNMDTLDMDCDTVWTHKTFHGRRQEKSVILKNSEGQSYARLHLLFMVSISNTTHDVAFIHNYSAVPPSLLSEDDHDTGFLCLMLEDLPTHTRFTSPQEFVHAAFIVNTDDNWVNCYFLNDLVDNDMYFRLSQ